MPKVVVSKVSALSPDEAFKKVQSLLEKDTDLKKLDPKISYTFDAAKRSGSAKGSLFTAEMSVAEKNGSSHVEIAVDLPFALIMIKGVVAKTLEKKLNEHLA